MTALECYLVNSSNTGKNIKITSAVTLGRCLDTGITDSLVSRSHTLFEPNFEKRELKVTQLGKLSSKVNEKPLPKQESALLVENDVFMFLDNKYTYTVNFRPSLDTSLSKRKLSDCLVDNKSNKRIKTTANYIVKKSAGSWIVKNDIVIYTSEEVKSSKMIASYDIDGTIITTKSGRVFATDTSDWKLIYPEVTGCLKNLHSKGYKIVFFTNQMGIEKGKVKLSDFQVKVENIVNELSVPIQVFVSISSGVYRKPSPGMWDYLHTLMNDDIIIDKANSFYVGDAAGRPKDWIKGMKKDFSCSDRLFSLNLGLKFETPEEHFLKQKPAKYNLPDFKPHDIFNQSVLYSPATSTLVNNKKELLLLVGFPASGKSHFVKTHLIPSGYAHINRDSLKTWQACVAKAQDAIKAGKSVVIDNTNPDKESRKRFIALAQEAKISCRCFLMNVSFEHAKHNEKFREMIDKSHQHISDMVYNIYKSKYQAPDMSEGYDEIVSINFVPSFKSKKDEELYKHYLLEK